MIAATSIFSEEINKSEFAVFPQFAYSQETGFWGGLITYYRYPLRSIPTLKNHLDFQIVYTEKKQLQLKFFPVFNFQQGLSKLNLDLSYQKWPSEFYGVDNSDPQKEMVKYTSEMVTLQADFQRYLTGNLFYHLYADQMKSVILQRQEPAFFSDIPGNEPYFLSGLGAGIAYDSRDSQDFPNRGIFALLKVNSFRNWWGSDYDYENLVLDLRQYLPIKKDHVLAFQQYLYYSSDLAPFQKLFKLGQYVRSYQNEIFLNYHGAALRAEYRFFPFSGKYLQNIGFAFFFDAGMGMQDWQELAFSRFRCSFGAGLRFSIFLKDRFNLRFDYGRCIKHSAIDIGGGESF